MIDKIEKQYDSFYRKFSKDFDKKKVQVLINILFVLSIINLTIIISDYNLSESVRSIIRLPYNLFVVLFALLSLVISFSTFVLEVNQKLFKIVKASIFLFSLSFVVVSIMNITRLESETAIYKTMLGIYLSIFTVIAFGNKAINFNDKVFHPSLYFVLSFSFVILMCTIGLLLPQSTTKPISFIDALFTATSAVTVTGLAVVDTGAGFTLFGQIVILIGIQLGGLGVLTFSYLFSLLFVSESSYKNRLFVGGIANELNSSNAFKTLFKIVFMTLLVEIIGAIFIQYSIKDFNQDNKIFFSIFHSISAYCNAGFSPLSNSLYEGEYRFNYSFHWAIAWLLITGGIGYKIMINHYKIIKNFLIKKANDLFGQSLFNSDMLYRRSHVHTTLVMNTSIILLVLGFVGFFIFEWNGTLQEHNTLWGKLTVCFFNSATPRTAGFNVVSMADLKAPTILLILFLMWIGASPGSTGGGVKTTTFAISVMNIINQIRGKDAMIVNYRKISSLNIVMSNSIIFLSALAIGGGTFLLAIFDPSIDLQKALFECVSAYSTVGLSIGITGSLSLGSKIVIIILMFLGRVGFLTVLIGFYNQFFGVSKKSKIVYPRETIYIG